MSIRHYTSLTLLMGPMRSNKSSRLLDEAVKSAKAGFITLFVNSKLDTRNPESTYSTHNPLLRNKMFEELNLEMRQCEKLADITDISNYDTIIIDEGQFFTDLYDSVLHFVNKLQKRVIVGGLDGDCCQRNFGDMHKLIPWADNVQKFCAFCQVCAKKKLMIDAPFTYRKEVHGANGTQIVVGDSIYLSLCRKCLLHHQQIEIDDWCYLETEIKPLFAKYKTYNAINIHSQEDLLKAMCTLHCKIEREICTKLLNILWGVKIPLSDKKDYLPERFKEMGTLE